MPAEMTDRRFPPPWSIEELDECFIVRDANGQALGYFYFDEEQQWFVVLAFVGIPV